MKKKLLMLMAVIIACFITYYMFTKDSELESKYFVVEGGSYSSSTLPIAENGPELISEIQLNKTVITGGSNIISFTSSVLLNEAMISTKEVSGYIKVPLEYTYNEASKLYNYTMVLLLSQKLFDKFHFDMVVKANDGTISKPYSSEINVIKAGTGNLQISLSWNIDDDIDLHVFEPDGTEVYYASPFSFPDDMDENEFYFNRNVWVLNKYKPDNNNQFNHTSIVSKLKLKALLLTLWGKIDMRKETSLYMRENNIAYVGELDIDSNPACQIDGIRNENIFYVKPEPGTYIVKVKLYSKCSDGEGAKYAVAVKYDNKNMLLDSGADRLIGQFHESLKVSDLVEVCTFTIPGERRPSVKKEKADTDMSTYFDKAARLFN